MGSLPPGAGCRCGGDNHCASLQEPLLQDDGDQGSLSLRDVWQHSPFLSCPPALPLVSAGPRCLLYLGPCGIKWKQGASFPQLLWTQVSPQVPVCWCSSAFVLVETLEVKSFNQKTQFCHNLNISWGHVTHGYVSGFKILKPFVSIFSFSFKDVKGLQ